MNPNKEERLKNELMLELSLTDEEAEEAMQTLNTVKCLVHDLKESSSDPTGEAEEPTLEAIRSYLGL